MAKVSQLVRDNAADYRRQLIAYAMTVAREEDAAEELVQAAFVEALSSDFEMADGGGIYFLCRVVSNRWLADLRYQARRRGSFSIDALPSGSVGFIPKTTVRPNQHQAAEVAEAERAMLLLPKDQREVLRLKALEFDDNEVAAMLGCEKHIVTNRRRRAQAEMCRLLGRPPPNLGGSKSGFRGVRKAGKRWVAECQSTKLGKLYLGVYDSPEEAALAFDMGGLARLGDRAILNFPDLKEQLLARLAAGENPAKLIPGGGGAVMKKLSDDDVRAVRRRIEAGEKSKEIASNFGISLQTVTDIRRGAKRFAAILKEAA